MVAPILKSAHRTYRLQPLMSALGHKQTFAMQNRHVRFTPDSGHVQCTAHVRFVPIAAMGSSLDQLINARKQCRRHRETERLCGLEVDHEIKSGWLFYG